MYTGLDRRALQGSKAGSNKNGQMRSATMGNYDLFSIEHTGPAGVMENYSGLEIILA